MYSRPVWYIKGIPMRIFKWTSQFHVDCELPLTPIWISLPRLPIHFFDRDTLFAIAALIGVPLRLNSATISLKRPSMARVQVELDILKERPSKIWIATEGEDGFRQKIVYDQVPDYCRHCWHIGHSKNSCRVQHPELRKDVRSNTQSQQKPVVLPSLQTGATDSLPCNDPTSLPVSSVAIPTLQ